MSYDNTGKASLWKNQSDNEKAPILKGTLFAHRDIKAGEPFELALWRNQSDNPKAPTLTGKLSDKQERQQAPADDFSESIPF